MNDILTRGAAELVRLMSRGVISPVEVVEAHIDRIEAVNPIINAMVTTMFNRARYEAERAASRYANQSHDLPPLFGLPVTIKDALPVRGIQFTGGLARNAGNIPDDDAEAVRRLKRAGAIILGKTNLPALSSSTETNNKLFGLTRNPHDPSRTAGGSSGGEGALIAAGGSPLGLGADIGGSIRLPSAMNGCVGLKPTTGRIPIDGHLPPEPEPLKGWNTVGPLARRVEDLYLALRVLSDVEVFDFRGVTLQGRRVIILPYLPFFGASRSIRDGIDDAARVLGEAQMDVKRDADLPMTRAGFEWAAVIARDWLPSLQRDLGEDGQPLLMRQEFIKMIQGNASITPNVIGNHLPAEMLGPLLLRIGYGKPGKLAAIREELLEAMGPEGVMLWPVFPVTAPKHGHAWNGRFVPVYTGIFNAMGLPAVVVPVGKDNKGLPVSVQVIGKPGQDEMALSVASVLEDAFGGWQIADIGT